MAVNEIIYVDPQIMLLDEDSIAIPAGTMAVIPHVPLEHYHEEFEKKTQAESNGEEYASDCLPLPEGTILVCAQTLRRADYPELSPLFSDGGFYDFTLPDLTKKFIVGVNPESNEVMYGDGIVYYRSIPKPERTGQPQIVNAE
jgi:hypothetical protein